MTAPAGDERPTRDASFRAAVMGVAATALVLAVLGLFAFGASAGLGVAVGGALATVNLIFFARLVEAFLAQKGAAAPWAILGFLKLLGLFAVAWIVLKMDLFSPLSFAVGYGALPIGITVSTLLRKPPADDPPPEAPARPSRPPPDEDVVDGPRP
jgi:hypothetical protein